MFFLASLILSFTQLDAKLAYSVASSIVENCTPRESGSPNSARAALHIAALAIKEGVRAHIDKFEDETPVGKLTFTNVEAEFCINPDLPWVVFISHYDTKPYVECPGANDGASTSALLVALAKKVNEASPKKANILFVWTDGEESHKSYAHNDGLHGARRILARLKANNRKIKAVVCLDMLGDKNLQISIPKNSTEVLKKIVHKVAKRENLSHIVKNINEGVYDDHVPFLSAAHPSICLIDFSYGSKPGLNDYWHTKNDTIDKISENSLLLSGRLAYALLKVLTN